MDTFGALGKAKRVVSLQIRSASVGDVWALPDVTPVRCHASEF